MTISKKQNKVAAKSNKAAVKAAPAPKAGKQATPAKPATVTAAAPVKVLSDTKQALNSAFIAKLPTARPVFQAKFKPLNLAAHTPTHSTDRDNAFLVALRAVYGAKPFTQQDSGADSGLLARAIALKAVIPAGNIDGKDAFKVA